MSFDPADGFALFDDDLASAGPTARLLTGWRETIRCQGAADFDTALTRIEAARGAGHWVALSAAYELGYALEPRLRPLLPATPTPLLEAWVFERHEALDGAALDAWIAARLDALPADARLAGVGGMHPSLDAAAHAAAVARIRDWIARGDCYQANFTHALQGRIYGHPLALYARLRMRQPVRHGACVLHDGGALLSRSPELFVERCGARLVCRPMKGTAPRHCDPAELAASEKDRAENLMIVDLIRNDLGRLAPPGAVRVPRLFEIEAYPAVWQMTSTVTAEPVDASLGEVLRALFPCGSVTGAPKIRAMEIIRDLEAAPRGVYCGALGWLAPDGDFSLNVPIRTLETDAAGRFRLGVGSGIVADSGADSEWQECGWKAAFLAQLPAGVGLIETLRCEPGAPRPYPRLDGHLDRLCRSAQWLGIECSRETARSALLARAATLDAGEPWRVRLALAADGRIEIDATPLPPPAAAPASAVLSPFAIDADDPLRVHKTTSRTLYDTELARVAALGHFDAIFLNQHGELVEGARTSLFLEICGELLTPPLAAGALDGVLRRELLAQGRAREARLWPADLDRAHRVLLGNALRGLTEVRVQR